MLKAGDYRKLKDKQEHIKVTCRGICNIENAEKTVEKLRHEVIPTITRLYGLEIFIFSEWNISKYVLDKSWSDTDRELNSLNQLADFILWSYRYDNG